VTTGGIRAAVGTAVGLLLLAGCVRVDVPDDLAGPSSTTAGEPERAGRAPDRSCDPYATLPPAETLDLEVERPETGTYLARVLVRGELRVGVDIATPQLSSLDPRTGRYEGFEVDLVRHIAAALFDRDPEDPDDVDEVIAFVAIRSADRTFALTDGRVDVVASAFSITCARRRAIAFSSPYLVAHQRILVHMDDDAQEPEDLEGRVICTSEGSTAIDNLLPVAEGARFEPAPERGDCLVRMQSGRADAMATDDAILAGMASQDSTLEVRGAPYSSEPYGLGVPPDEPEWLRYVNGVLAELVEDGTWHEMYDEYFGDSLEPADPPVPNYREADG
jgi:polar amino acid transport system substrate-binding protein